MLRNAFPMKKALLLLVLSLCGLLLGAAAQAQRTLVLPVTKDASTRQYLTRLRQRTPFVGVTLVVDLGSPYLWVDCLSNYVSSSYRPIHCGTRYCSPSRHFICKVAGASPRPGINNNACVTLPYDPFTDMSSYGELAQDTISIAASDGNSIALPRFVFVCGDDALITRFANGATGVLGLGQSGIGVPLQLSQALNSTGKFAMCLPSQTNARGVISFGEEPYNFPPYGDVSPWLYYTPLYTNPVSAAPAVSQPQESAEYFILVKDITVDNRRLRLNNTLLTIDKDGNGGTKISTSNPYTVLQSSIYRALKSAFIHTARARNITRVVPAVAPFDTCFKLRKESIATVPDIALTLDVTWEKDVAEWRITGANSMVQVSEHVACLGFVDGGPNAKTAIVIGGLQMEDNLLEFDLRSRVLGFTNSLLRIGRGIRCSNFNFTSPSTIF